MPRGKDFRAFDANFSISTAFINRVTEYIANPFLTKVRATYWNVVNHVIYERIEVEKLSAPGFTLLRKLEILSRIAKDIFGELDRINMATLKFHILNHIEVDLQKFRDVGELPNISTLS